MIINKQGCFRIVILIGNYAIKIPNFLNGYRYFLKGILSNHQEIMLSKNFNHHSKYCPVLFSIWGGWLNIMPKCQILTDEEFINNINEEWLYIKDVILTEDAIIDRKLPVELKSDSFGWLNGRIVSVDYGS